MEQVSFSSSEQDVHNLCVSFNEQLDELEVYLGLPNTRKQEGVLSA